jgi:hypothetical protein
MPAMNYTVGLHNVGSYQVSGIPFATGSVDCPQAVEIRFPGVTKWVTVANHGSASVKVGFSAYGLRGSEEAGSLPHNRFLRIPPHTSGSSCVQTFDVKVTSIWLSGSNSVDVMAGLTSIKTDAVNNSRISPSGSNWSGSLAAQV